MGSHRFKLICRQYYDFIREIAGRTSGLKHLCVFRELEVVDHDAESPPRTAVTRSSVENDFKYLHDLGMLLDIFSVHVGANVPYDRDTACVIGVASDSLQERTFYTKSTCHGSTTISEEESYLAKLVREGAAERRSGDLEVRLATARQYADRGLNLHWSVYE